VIGAIGENLTVVDVIGEVDIPRSGPAKALEHYLDEPDNLERLAWLTRAVLFARKMPTDLWQQLTSDGGRGG
jgi:hypothetical protein